MVTFKDRIEGKPSVAIRAMVRGLREMGTWPNWKVNMSTFFMVDTEPGDDGVPVEVCHACAATAAIMKLGNTRFHPDMQLGWCSNSDGRVLALDTEWKDYSDFEAAMNNLRMGFPPVLFQYCGQEFVEPVKPLPWMDSHNWESLLPRYEAYAEQLEKLGL